MTTMLLVGGFVYANEKSIENETNVESLKKNTRRIKESRKRKAFNFVEQGKEFHVFAGGDFDFDGTESILHGKKTSSTLRTRTSRDQIQYDALQRVKGIGNINVQYDDFGRIAKAGNVAINYNRLGLVSAIGGLKVYYDASGKVRKLEGQVNPTDAANGYDHRFYYNKGRVNNNFRFTNNFAYNRGYGYGYNRGYGYGGYYRSYGYGGFRGGFRRGFRGGFRY